MDGGEGHSGLFDADESASENMRPDFSPQSESSQSAFPVSFAAAKDRPGVDYRSEKKDGRWVRRRADRDDKKNDARSALKNNELGASKNPNEAGRGGDKNASLGEKEGNVESDSTASKFKNAVKGAQAIKKGNLKEGRARTKKAGPLISLLVIMFGYGLFTFTSQLTMPFSLIAQIKDRFDTVDVQQNMRSKVFLKYQLSAGNIKDCRKAHIFKADEFKPTTRMRNKLEPRGITFTDEGGMTVMKYKGQTIVADKSLATEDGSRVFFDDFYDSNSDFRKDYTAGASTWRGSVKTWFDEKIDGLLQRLGINRNLWDDYKKGKTGDGTDADDMEVVRQKVADTADSDEITGKQTMTDVKNKPEVDADDNPTGRQIIHVDERATEGDDLISLGRQDIEVDANGKVTSTAQLESKITKIGNNIEAFKKISSLAVLATQITCGVSDFVGVLSGILAVFQINQVVKSAMAIFEAIQKGKIGDGGPLNEVAVSLTTQTESSYTKVKDVNISGNTSSAESMSISGVTTETTTRSRSAMEANGTGALYGGYQEDPNDPSVASFNVNTAISSTYTGLAKVFAYVNISAASFRQCAQARIAAAAVGAATDAIELVGCAAAATVTFGLAILGCLAGEMLESGAIQAAVQLAVQTVVSFITPFIVNSLMRKMVREFAGEDLGNAILFGGNYLHGKNAQLQGPPATENTYIAYRQVQDQVVADRARVEREGRSPFDMTSKYTFMGSLATQMIPLLSQSTGISGFIHGAGTVLGNAITSLTPKSSAVSAAIEAHEILESTNKNCPNISDASNGTGLALSDCTALYAPDLSTMNIHPAEVVDDYISDDDLDVDEDGNPYIKKNSNLATYINVCTQSDVPAGMKDSGVESMFSKTPDDIIGTNIPIGGTSDSGGDNQSPATGNASGSFQEMEPQVTIAPVSTFLNSTPVFGDLADAIDSGAKLAYRGWIFKNACYPGYEPSADEKAVSWETSKYYAQYISDQRLAEAQGYGESTVSKYLREYYEEHPLDQSPEGILARRTGYTKEQIVATLDTIELFEFIAEYEPATKFPYPAEEEKEKQIVLEEKNVYDGMGIFAVIQNSFVSPARKEAYIA